MKPEIQLSYELLEEIDYKRLNDLFAGSDELDVIKWTYQTFQDDVIYACSFGAEGMVLLDLIHKVYPEAIIVFIDTNVHFQETYELIERVKQKYPSFRIKIIQTSLTLEEQALQYGDALWKRNPDLCCNIRKIHPLSEVLAMKKAWLSGLRREQSPIRAKTQFINKDDKFSSIKICPLIHWNWEDVWDYILTHQLPYNPLHKRGYPSIGCIHCTKPLQNESDLRSGRWVGLNKTECGLHLHKPLSF